MTVTPHKPPKDLSKYPDKNLLAVLLSDNASVLDKADCKLEMDKRLWKRDFWIKGIVAWIALIISMISIAISLLKG